MIKSKGFTSVTFLALVMLAYPNQSAHAAQCGNGPAGFEAWKQQFAGEARAKGISAGTV